MSRAQRYLHEMCTSGTKAHQKICVRLEVGVKNSDELAILQVLHALFERARLETAAIGAAQPGNVEALRLPVRNSAVHDCSSCHVCRVVKNLHATVGAH